MQSQKGTVIALQSGADGRRALVAVDIAAVCPRCAEGKGCGAGISLRRDRQVQASIPQGVELAAGDSVDIALAPNNVLRAATIVYGWPLASAAVAAALAWMAQAGDAAAALAAIAGLGLGLWLARRRLRGCLKEFTPQVLV